MIYDVDQARAIREARAWLDDPSPQPQIRYLAGVAGSGKTTIAREITEGHAVSFVAPTGKAAGVLRRKGCDGAATIHSTIYRAVNGELGAPPEFVLRGQDPFDNTDPDPFDGVAAIVADECSMIDDDVWKDLLSFRRKILVIGDPFQLPPVKPSATGPWSLSPTWLLTQVHRQALESGVLRAATDVREGRGLCRSPGAYGDDVAVAGFEAFDMALIAEHCDQVLVGKNDTRHAWNGWIREEVARLEGREIDALPRVHDRLVCLRNDKRRGLANGAVWLVEAVDRDFDGALTLDVVSEDGERLLALPTWEQPFRGHDMSTTPWRERRQRAEFSYAYALTVHKSQGSEWPSVCVIDESSIFGADAARHLYTAITRSSGELVVIA